MTNRESMHFQFNQVNRNKRRTRSIFPPILFALAFLALAGVGRASEPLHTLTQVSTIDALLAGAYDGQMTLENLRSYGNFGIGTFDRLDGEMVMLDGKICQVRGDGKVYTPPQDATTPFASVVNFHGSPAGAVPKGADFKALTGLIDSAQPNANLFCAIKVKGKFSNMKVRSVPAQKKPYPPLTEVTKDQPVFEYKNVSGTIVGFRSPPYVKGINVPGCHLHFLSDDGKVGGHILEFIADEGELEIDVCNRFLMILPEGNSAFGGIDLSRDRSKELDKAEK